MSKSKSFTMKVCRSAKTGKFVSVKYAKKHPKTTTTEVMKIKKAIRK